MTKILLAALLLVASSARAEDVIRLQPAAHGQCACSCTDSTLRLGKFLLHRQDCRTAWTVPRSWLDSSRPEPVPADCFVGDACVPPQGVPE